MDRSPARNTTTMTRTRTRNRPTAATLLTGGLLLFPLAACTDAPVADDGAATSTEAPAEDTGTGEATESEVAGSPTEVDCSGRSCELTLQSGQEAEVLGTTIAFTTSQDGTATIRIGNDDASCRQGEAVEAGPLSLECTTVTDDSVTLTASLG